MALGARRVDREGAFAGRDPKRAIIDIGSNSVRMVLYGGSLRAPDVLFNEKVIARLGRDMDDGQMREEAMDLAMRGIRRYALILRDLGIDDVEVVATAAVREANNASVFLEQVRATGLDPRVLPGEEEARLSAMGVVGAFPGADGVVADLGGGSLELLRLKAGDCQPGISLPLGTLRLPGLAKGNFDESAEKLEYILAEAGWDGDGADTLYLVGGTLRAMAVHRLYRDRSILTDPHGFELTSDDAMVLARDVAETDFETFRANPRISTLRAELMPCVGPLFAAMLRRMEPKRVVFSSWGLREGVLFDRLPQEQRAQDPLLAGISVFANMRGCPPTLAARMAGWTVNAIPQGWSGSERIRHAATSLALASMQIEPNLRTEIAVDWALQKRWLAVSAEERALMAATVAANGNHCEFPDRLLELADPARFDAAICWGLALRLCRRLGGRSRESLSASRLAIEGNRLILSIEEERAALSGLPTEKDMELLAGRLQLSPTIEIVPDGALSDSAMVGQY